MEMVIIVVVIVLVCVWYGLFGVMERVVKMGHKELDQLEKQHDVSIANRLGKLDKELTSEKISQVASTQAKMKALRDKLDNIDLPEVEK